MDNLKNIFVQLWKDKKNDDTELPESHARESGSSTQYRILAIQRAERAALLQRVQRLCAAQEAHRNAVLERLGFTVQRDPLLPSPLPLLPSPLPQTVRRRSPGSSLLGGRSRALLKVEESNSVRRARTNQRQAEEDPFFEKKLRLGSQMAIAACKMYKLMSSPEPPISPVDSLSSTDTHTPSELRAIAHLGDYTLSLPPPSAPRRPSRLPVRCRQLNAAEKTVADCRLQTITIQLEELMEKMEQLNLNRGRALGLPRPPSVPERVQEGTAMAPTPPSAAASPKTKTKTKTGGPGHGTHRRQSNTKNHLQPPRVKNNHRALKPVKTLCPVKAVKPAAQVDIQPLENPCVSLCFGQLSSQDWEKKLDGFISVRALVQHHPQLLLTKLHEFCLVVAEEVANLRSSVACAAIDTITDLHVHLGRAMDPEAERTGLALLLKLAQTSNDFIHQQTNLALDALVENCSPNRVIRALLGTGLSKHRNIALRASIAQHLQLLSVVVGEDQTLAVGKTFADRFVTAVSKMSVDAAPEVRFYGQMMLQGLAHQTKFLNLWSKLVPAKDRRPLDKILKKMKL